MTKAEQKLRQRLDKLTREERSTLLYLESCMVDYGGRWHYKRTNEDDREIMMKWQKKGWLNFGRIVLKDGNKDGLHWVRLGPRLLKLAQAERRARIDRMWDNRRWQTTLEKNRGTHDI